MTRTLLTPIILLSLAVQLSLLPIHRLVLFWPRVFAGDLWRPITSFCLAGKVRSFPPFFLLSLLFLLVPAPSSIPHSLCLLNHLPPSLAHSLTHLPHFTHSRAHSRAHSLTHSRAHSLTHSLTHSLRSFARRSQDFALLFDLFTLYRNSASLEASSPTPAAHAHRLLLLLPLLLALTYPLRLLVLFRPLLHAITYLWARANPSASVSLFGLFAVPATAYPFALAALDLSSYGPHGLKLALVGILAGHILHYLEHDLPPTSTLLNILQTPQWLQSFFQPSVPAAAAADPAQTAPGRVRNTTYGATIITPQDSTGLRARPAAGSTSNPSEASKDTGRSTGYSWGSKGHSLS